VNTRITTGMVQRNVLSDLNAVSDKLVRAQLKASSGKEITRPSDDPFNASRAMALRQDQAGVVQYQRNVEDARGWQETTEQALGSITDALQRARDLLVQGGSDTLDQTSRDSIAAELEQLLEGIKQSANATYRGSYIFAGSDTASPPYKVGDTSPTRDVYGGDLAGLNPAIPGIVREIGPKVTMSINVVGEEMLGNGQTTPPESPPRLLAVLRNAIDDMKANNGAAVRGTDLPALDANLDKLLEVRARNGARSNRLESALSRLGEVEDAGRKQLSDVEDADIAKTMIELSSQSAAYQAALRSGANIVQSSLMDFLR
jgi:flagellar hook-associated protein 3 FlgL